MLVILILLVRCCAAFFGCGSFIHVDFVSLLFMWYPHFPLNGLLDLTLPPFSFIFVLFLFFIYCSATQHHWSAGQFSPHTDSIRNIKTQGPFHIATLPEVHSPGPLRAVAVAARSPEEQDQGGRGQPLSEQCHWFQWPCFVPPVLLTVAHKNQFCVILKRTF